MLIERPTPQIVYEPKVKYHVDNKVPPRASDSFLGWVSPLLHTKEPELVDKIGLDAAIYLRFVRMCRWLFSAIAALTCAVLAQVHGSIYAWGGVMGLLRLATAAILGACVGAVVGPLTLSLVSPASWPVDPAVWIFRNAVSAFVLVSAGVAFRHAIRASDRLTGRAGEAAGILTAAAAINAAVFLGATGVPLGFAGEYPRAGDPGCPRDCGGRVGVLHHIVFGFCPAGVTGQAALLAKPAEILPAGEQLMHIGLVARIENDRVPR